jgi:hypothetical protein
VKLAVALVGLSAFVAAAPARAEVDDLGAYGERHWSDQQSEQDMAIELRFGRYVPNVDDGLAERPYERIFGSSNRYYVGFEADWQMLRIPYFGTLGPGFGIGFTRSSGSAIIESTGERSDQPTSLSILPMYLVAVARVDVLAQELSIPIVPYAKLGLGYALWWTKSGDKTPEAPSDGRKGRGRSLGPQFALGVMLQLDWLDRDDVLSADASIGMNHSYLFAEWYRSELDGFGGDQLDAGTDTWMVGIAAEF